MKKCHEEQLIDQYLLNKLSEPEKARFEEHYFNCPQCFEKMAARDEVISVIKSRGAELFQDILAPKEEKASLLQKIPAFFTPKQWAVVAVSAALLVIVAFGIWPRFRGVSPSFVLDEEGALRGQSITLISPVVDAVSVPSRFEWKRLEEDVEYHFSLKNGGLLWKKTTKDNFLILPDEARKKMRAGSRYSWQVKAFSRQGALVAVSSRVQFMIR